MIRVYFTRCNDMTYASPHDQTVSLRSSWRSGSLHLASSGINFPIWFTIPINRCSSLTVVGVGKFYIATFVCGSATTCVQSFMLSSHIFICTLRFLLYCALLQLIGDAFVSGDVVTLRYLRFLYSLGTAMCSMVCNISLMISVSDLQDSH